MPKYDYKCKDCDTKFHLFHSVNEINNLCINCKSINIQKIYSINKIVSDTPIKNVNIGEETRKIIEENTQVLDSMRKIELEL